MTNAHQKIAVIIPAAGQGTRMGGVNKQYRLLGNKPVLIQTLWLFEHSPSIDDIVVVTDAKHLDEVKEKVKSEGFTKIRAVVLGEDTRQKSVMKGLEALDRDVEYVLVHDAVRPFVTEDQIEQVVRATQAYDAAALAVPIADALRKGHDGLFDETVERAGIYRMQTPQGFRRETLVKAYQEAFAQQWEAHDDVDLVQKLGQAVRIIEGSSANIKITTPNDWLFSQKLWQIWND